jgi:type I phosphodiesterase/nucleotide pyrophosphatase
MSIRPARSSALVVTLLVFAGCVSGGAGDGGRPASGSAPPVPGPSVGGSSAGRIADSVCAVPRRLLLRTWRGDRRDRSGDIQLLPAEPDFVGHGGLPHSGPWDYISNVPLFWYGPGYVPATGRIARGVTLADIAPTQGELIGFPFDAPDGRVLVDALVPVEQRAEPPRLVVLVVWDGAGTDVLDEWPRAWPYLSSLIEHGVWYDRAEVGSSPPSTAQIHATMGTGAFSRTHGLVAHHFRIGGQLATPWQGGPSFLIQPTLGDLYDRAMANRPVVGAIATVAIHLGMLGHGAMFGGGDRDVAVLREIEGAATLGAEGIRWQLTSNVASWYRFPEYVNGLPPISTYFPAVDRMDGRVDGAWLGHDLEGGETLAGFHTPARIPYQTRLVQEVIRREGFGADEVTDLLSINYKLTDEIGHIYSMNSVEMRDSIQAQDAGLRELVRTLDAQVGPGKWVLALTADHGHTPDPDVSGATVISPTRVADTIDGAFDRDGDDVPVVEFVQPTHVFIDREELREQGYSLTEVAAYLMTVTKRVVGSEQWPVPESRLDEPAFLAAYPSRLLRELPCVPHADRPPTT